MAVTVGAKLSGDWEGCHSCVLTLGPPVFQSPLTASVELVGMLTLTPTLARAFSRTNTRNPDTLSV